jgi:hypothetical protein
MKVSLDLLEKIIFTIQACGVVVKQEREVDECSGPGDNPEAGLCSRKSTSQSTTVCMAYSTLTGEVVELSLCYLMPGLRFQHVPKSPPLIR